MERKSFVFYKSFYDAISILDESRQLKLFKAIAEYGLFGSEPEEDEFISLAFLLIKPQIDTNNEKFLNGCKGAEHGKKGGRPSKKNPTKTPEKPHQNPTKTPNENVNENANENEHSILTNNTTLNKDNSSAGAACSLMSSLPAGMSKEEYERRMKEARE